MLNKALTLIWKIITGGLHKGSPTDEDGIIFWGILFVSGVGIALVMVYIKNS